MKCRVPYMSVIVLLGMTMFLCGCGPRNYLNDNDQLREANLHLTRQVAALKDKLKLQEADVAALQQRLHLKPANMPKAVLPRLTSLALTRFSGIIREAEDRSVSGISGNTSSGNGLEKTDHFPRQAGGYMRKDLGKPTGRSGAQVMVCRLYLRTLDQQGRMMPVAGKATVTVVVIPDQGPPRQVARKVFDPTAFDQAYRASLMGTHYVLDLPLDRQKLGAAGHVTVKVVFVQAGTGVTLRLEQVFPVPPPHPI